MAHSCRPRRKPTSEPRRETKPRSSPRIDADENGSDSAFLIREDPRLSAVKNLSSFFSVAPCLRGGFCWCRLDELHEQLFASPRDRMLHLLQFVLHQVEPVDAALELV